MLNANVKTLIVDDSPTTRKIIRNSLSSDGFKLLEEASDGEQAWLMLTKATTAFDLVIADWHMPNLSGLELLKKIRSNEKLKLLAVVMATAEKNKESVIKVLDLGVSGFLIKPYEEKTLLALVHKIIFNMDK